jgi:hypothetical protein
MHRETLIGQAQSGGHTCYTAADHQGAVLHRHSQRVLRLELRGPGDSHAHQFMGFLCSCRAVLRMNPGTLVANVRHLKQIWVETSRSQAILEERLVSQGSTAGNHDSVEPIGFDLFGDVFDAVLRTGIQVPFAMDHVRQSGGALRYVRHVRNPPIFEPQEQIKTPTRVLRLMSRSGGILAAWSG